MIACTSEDTAVILGALGFAARARRLFFGGDICEKGIRAGKVKASFVASDASANTVKKILNASNTYHVPCLSLCCTKEELSERIGKGDGGIACVALTDESFLNILKKTSVFRLLQQ